MASPYIATARILEGVLGRRMLWRTGRLLYQYARRDGYNDPSTNGEYLLHERLARLAAEQTKPLNIVDVGANIGYWSRHLLDACKEAGVRDVRLLAFEPSPENRARLTEALKSVPSTYRVKVRPEAVADVAGRSSFDGSTEISGTKRLIGAGERAENITQRIEVPVTTLTAVFSEEEIMQADLVKTDVEGFDLKVMQGALPLLDEGRIGLMQFEYNHCWMETRSFLRDVFDLVKGLRYYVCKVTRDGIEAYENWHPELESYVDVNYILIRSDLADSLGVREGLFDAYNTYATQAR